MTVPEERSGERNGPDTPVSGANSRPVAPAGEEGAGEKKKTRLSYAFFFFLGLGLFFAILSYVVYPHGGAAASTAYPNILLSEVPAGAQIQFVTYTVTPEQAKSDYKVNLEISVDGTYSESSEMFLNLEYPRNEKLTNCSTTFPLTPKAVKNSICPQSTGTLIGLGKFIDLDFTVNSPNDYYADDGTEATIALPEVRVVGGSLPLFRARYYLQDQAKKFDWSNADTTISGSVSWVQQVPPGGFVPALFETATNHSAQAWDNARIIIVGALIAIACSAFFEAIRRLFKV
jgi:hypothetical protein